MERTNKTKSWNEQINRIMERVNKRNRGLNNQTKSQSGFTNLRTYGTRNDEIMKQDSLQLGKKCKGWQQCATAVSPA